MVLSMAICMGQHLLLKKGKTTGTPQCVLTQTKTGNSGPVRS